LRRRSSPVLGTLSPGSAEGVIRIAALDAELVTFTPELISVLSASAPGLRLVARGDRPASRS
jgi:hypothetical protein